MNLETGQFLGELCVHRRFQGLDFENAIDNEIDRHHLV